MNERLFRTATLTGIVALGMVMVLAALGVLFGIACAVTIGLNPRETWLAVYDLHPFIFWWVGAAGGLAAVSILLFAVA